MLLHLKDAVSGYGSGEVLHGVTVYIDEGEMVSLIGPNGAGKSTILRTISGLLKLRKGQKIFNEKDISNLPSPKVSKLGIAQVPEGRLIFSPLTVLQNLLLGCYPRYRKLGENGRERLLKSVYEIFPILSQRKEQLAGTLSGGEQQMLAIGRALMAQPRLLMLDEPSLGLAPMIVHDIFRIIQEIRDAGTTILIVEQNAVQTLGIADWGYVLENGKIVLGGTGSELLENEQIRVAYLGL